MNSRSLRQKLSQEQFLKNLHEDLLRSYKYLAKYEVLGKFYRSAANVCCHSEEATHSRSKDSLILLLLCSIEVLAITSGCPNLQTSKIIRFTEIIAP